MAQRTAEETSALLSFAWLYCPNTYNKYLQLKTEYDQTFDANRIDELHKQMNTIMMNIAGLHCLYQKYPDMMFDSMIDDYFR